MSHDGKMYWYRPVYDSDGTLGVDPTADNKHVSHRTTPKRAPDEGESEKVVSGQKSNTAPDRPVNSAGVQKDTSRAREYKILPDEVIKKTNFSREHKNPSSGVMKKQSLLPSGSRSPSYGFGIKQFGIHNEEKSAGRVESEGRDAFAALQSTRAPTPKKPHKARESGIPPVRVLKKASVTQESQFPSYGFGFKEFGLYSDEKSPIPLESNDRNAYGRFQAGETAVIKRTDISRESRKLPAEEMKKRTVAREPPNPSAGFTKKNIVAEDSHIPQPAPGLKHAVTKPINSETQYSQVSKREILCDNGTCRLRTSNSRKDRGIHNHRMGRLASPERNDSK